MHKLVVLACVLAFAACASAGAIGLGFPGAGYGYVSGFPTVPNLGFGNLAKVNHQQNGLGYGIGKFEAGPLSVRSHVQTAHAPLGIGIPVVAGAFFG